MKTRLAVAVVGTVLAGIVATTFWSGRASTAEPAVERPTVGRYQILVRDELGGGPDAGTPGEKAYVVRNRLVVLDTATGQCWQRDDKDKKWEDLGNPTKSK
jgi:hypothetical protein